MDTGQTHLRLYSEEILAERRRCVGLVLALFATYRERDQSVAEALDRLALAMEHPDLDSLETAYADLRRDWKQKQVGDDQ